MGRMGGGPLGLLGMLAGSTMGGGMGGGMAQQQQMTQEQMMLGQEQMMLNQQQMMMNQQGGPNQMGYNQQYPNQYGNGYNQYPNQMRDISGNNQPSTGTRGVDETDRSYPQQTPGQQYAQQMPAQQYPQQQTYPQAMGPGGLPNPAMLLTNGVKRILRHVSTLFASSFLKPYARTETD